MKHKKGTHHIDFITPGETLMDHNYLPGLPPHIPNFLGAETLHLSLPVLSTTSSLFKVFLFLKMLFLGFIFAGFSKRASLSAFANPLVISAFILQSDNVLAQQPTYAELIFKYNITML